jgi:hypothetical protein
MTIRSNSPYVPSFIKAARTDGKPVQMSYSDFNLSDTNHGSIDSFKYDPLGYPLKSTQQLNLDWSKFENHTFFSSAEVKVNDAFNRIINNFPFDGTKKEVEEFLDSLTGFEKWVLESFPKWSGALHFSGTQVGEIPSSTRGNWIAVKDKSGTMFPELSKNNKGEVVLTPGDDDSLSVEMLLNIPEQTNDTQVIFQKSSSNNSGFTFHLQPSTSTTSVNATFSVTSGSVRNSVTGILTKGTYNHICVVLNKKDMKEDSLQFFLNEELAATSTGSNRIRKLDIDTADFLIGSGSSFYNLNSLIIPTQTLSGTIDEFRVFHSTRDTKSQKLYASRGLYASQDLKLYFRFNEPSGSLSLDNNNEIESIVLDSSGNSLHANINNFNFSLRKNVAADENNILVNEKDEFKTILFPAYNEITHLNADLLASASNYDRFNPNLILKLIPRHYLLEGAAQDGFSTVQGNSGDSYGGSGVPGQGQKGSSQIILSFLYIWAKFFDEIKTYIDSFVTLRTVKYDSEETIPDNFLEDMVKYYGFYLPKFFNHASVDQFAEGDMIDGVTDIGTPLKKIQATMLRRVLVNMPDIIKSKGTQHSIKSFLRSVGIDPENSLRIREYGGPTTKQLTASREKRIEPGAMVNFTGSSLVISSPLSASRVEPGYPAPVGSFQRNSFNQVIGTTFPPDGMLTSGSWNLDGVFKMPPQKITDISDDNGYQSLIRMIVTGSAATAGPGLVLNVVATQFVEHPEEPATIQAYIRPGISNSSPLLTLSLDLNGKGIFDGEKWNVSVGCIRNDELDSYTSSSYYLRVAKNDAGELNEVYVTSSYFLEQIASEGNVFRSGSTQHNISGTYICMGSNQAIPSLSSYYFLNDTLNVPDIARTVEYVGWASNVKFWSKAMSEDEWREHARNPKSFGVENPLVNYNFVKNVSGSFQKLRLDSLLKQPERNADNLGHITFLDYSQNEKHMFGSGFISGSKVLLGELFNYSYLSPMFDEASTDDKMRIRSFASADLVKENPGAIDAPSYLSNDMFTQEEPQDDLRLSIEFSMVDSLDKDIVSMFSSFDKLNDVLGRPELMFSPDYPELENLRDVYFNRLSGKPDFRKFLEFYRWFDTSISSFIEQLVPSKTLYKGSNFVVESHMLERHKNMYKHSGNYLGDRQVIEDSLLVQQIVGKLKKY